MTPPAPFGRLGFLARVTTRDGRAIEEALSGATLFDSDTRLDGAVIEASYAASHPPLLKRLGDDGVPRIFDSQSLRFVGDRFLQVPGLRVLPYAPERPYTVNEFTAGRARDLARGALGFSQDRGADLYLAPALPLLDDDRELWLDHNARILDAACTANGGSDLDRRPIVATVAPGQAIQRNPARVIDRLLDFPIDGVYLQPLNLAPTRDSLEKLARFVQFMAAIRDAGFPVAVGRVGAFGLVLQVLGATTFDSGLGLAEGHDLGSLNRAETERDRERRITGEGGGPTTRVYLESLKTTMDQKHADPLLRSPELRHHFTCSKPCCRFTRPEELASRSRKHYLCVRRAEVDAMERLSVSAMRLVALERDLHQARDLARQAKRLLPSAGLPSFDHLDRWLGLIAREQELADVA